MLRGVYAASITMDMAFKKLDITAENISNAHTYGYKKKTYATHAFKDMMVQLANGEMAPVSTGLKLTNAGISQKQGVLRPTGNPLDVAIEGEDGFFQVEYINPRTQEASYEITRNGHFTVNEKGELMTYSGAYVLDESDGHISVPFNIGTKGSQADTYSHISIDKDGTLINNTKKGKEPIAKFKIVSFEDAKPEDALNLADALSQFGLDDSKINTKSTNMLDIKEFEVRQGFLEESNVNLVTEMVMFMMSSKNYGMSEKIIQTMDKTMDKSINEMGRMQ